MGSAQPKPELQLSLVREYAVSRDKVFRAWTDPKALMQWFCPSDAYTVRDVLLEPYAGGRYRISLLAPDGIERSIVGRYQQFDPPQQLVFTWAWENDPECGETLVTVRLHDLSGRTKLVLTHERFLTEGARDCHQTNHAGILDRLQRYLEAQI